MLVILVFNRVIKNDSSILISKSFYYCNKFNLNIYTKHIYTFLANICTHLLFVFQRQPNFSLISLGLFLCKAYMSRVQVFASTEEK